MVKITLPSGREIELPYLKANKDSIALIVALGKMSQKKVPEIVVSGLICDLLIDCLESKYPNEVDEILSELSLVEWIGLFSSKFSELIKKENG